MARSDDLAPILAARPAPAVGYRQGEVTAWDAGSYANTVTVDGTTMANLPVLDVADAALIVAGDTVAILTYGPTWLILGRITVPT